MVSRKKSRVQASKVTTFITAQRIWIVEERSKLISPVKIMREFVKCYSIAPVAASKLKGHHFSCILQCFKETGSVATKKRGARSKRRICIPENIEKLRIHINYHPTVSIAQAAQRNNLPVSSTYRMIRIMTLNYSLTNFTKQFLSSMQFLNGKFENHVISRRSEFIWPAHSPELNPLNYRFWGQVEQ